MRVVSNTSPICYLVLIEEVRVLPELFTQILIPEAVSQELSHPDAPQPVRDWIAKPPDWFSVLTVSEATTDEELQRLDPGEIEAIQLAEQLRADLLILDDWKARELARGRGLPITGLIGVLDLAIQRGLVKANTVIQRLRTTNFRVSEKLLLRLLR